MNKIKLSGAKNIRDLSYLTNKDGGHIRKNLFIRGALLNKITPKDEDILHSLGLKTIIDLRTDMEKDEKADAVISGVENIHIPLCAESVAGITHEEKFDLNEKIASIPNLDVLYRAIASDKECNENLAKILHTVIEKSENGAVLWHCTEGKDRCGIVTATFLSLLGFDREVIVKDYLKTNRVAYKRAAKYGAAALVATKSRTKAAKVIQAFVAKQNYIEAFFDETETLCGSMDAFCEKRLGITREMRAELKKKYIEY